MSNIIELSELTKVFPGGIMAVDNLSLSIKEGEFVTLLGPSGCGKTTTLRMIAGFEIPTKGKISLAGEDVTELPPYQRQVNTVFQDYALFPHMTVAQNIGYGLRVAGVAKKEIGEKALEAMSMVGLLEKADDRPGQLSGGQKQRVALARALVRHPKVLLLDEPLSSLDAKLREAMQIELKHLHQRLGLTFVLVTHDQTEAMVMSDRIVVMEQGRIVQSGTPTELYDHPASAYVANFLGSSNMIPGRVTAADKNGATIGLDGRSGAAGIAGAAGAAGASGAKSGEATQGKAKQGEVRSLLDGKSLTPGEKALVSIRPEKIKFLEDGEKAPEGFNVLAGTVTDCLFQGNVIRIEINLDIGLEAPFFVEVHLRSTANRSAMPQPGTRASVAIDPHNVSVFPAGENQ